MKPTRAFAICLALAVAGLPTASLAPDAHGQEIMSALYLEGANQSHVLLPTKITDGLRNATVEAWVKWLRIRNWARVFDFGRQGHAVVVQSERDTPTLNFAIWDRKGVRHRVQKHHFVKPNTWYHLAVVCGTSGMKLYIDGELAAKDPYTGSLGDVGGGSNYIGKSNWPKDELLHGYIAEFRVWDASRTPREIVETMYSQLSGSEEHLLAYWRFDEAEGKTVKDLTGNGHDAALVGRAGIFSTPGPPIAKTQLSSAEAPPAATSPVGPAAAKAEPELAPPASPKRDLTSFRLVLEAALKDGKIDAKEKRVIESVRLANTIPEESAKEAELAVRKALGIGPQTPNEQTYSDLLEAALEEGKITDSETPLLENMGSSLGISGERAAALREALEPVGSDPEAPPAAAPLPAADPARDSYRGLVRTALQDRVISDNERTMLRQVLKTSGLSDEAGGEVEAEVMRELGVQPANPNEEAYLAALRTALADGELSSGEEALLSHLGGSLKIPEDRAQALRKAVEAQTQAPGGGE